MSANSGSTTGRVFIAAGVAALCILLVWLAVWWNRSPQMGADEEVFKAVDALFTAVRSRDENLLGQCEQRLHSYRDAGKLPADASAYLDGIISTAREGRWQAAAERLYGFMRAQRREGSHDHQPARKKDKGGPRSEQQ